MSLTTYAVTHATVVTPRGREALRGEAMGSRVDTLTDGAVVWDDNGVITYAGPAQGAPLAGLADSQVIDAGGRVVMPGFIDSHTHAVFGGYRPDEFAMRMEGASYMQIMNAGGGIQSTVNHTREASADALLDKTRWFLRQMVAMGVTTVEIKSGYGLDTATELKMLEVIDRLRREESGSLTIVPTFLGAHAVPREYKGRTAEYVDLLIREMLPRCRGLAQNCDVFCEKDVFELDESRRLLEAARAMGYSLKLHADEIVTLGGAELAADLGALSADHLLHISDAGIAALAGSTTVATLLPLTAFSLREPYAPARRLIDAGCAVALATDLNPGSCFSGSIPLMIALACIYMKMSVEETITALTLNGAAALGMAAETGSLEAGKRADLVMLHFDNYRMLPYYIGMNCVGTVVCGGRLTARN